MPCREPGGSSSACKVSLLGSHSRESYSKAVTFCTRGDVRIQVQSIFWPLLDSVGIHPQPISGNQSHPWFLTERGRNPQRKIMFTSKWNLQMKSHIHYLLVSLCLAALSAPLTGGT